MARVGRHSVGDRDATCTALSEPAVADNELAHQPCSEENLAKIANSVPDWRAVSPFLGLTEVDENAILESTHSVPARKMAMLRKWKQKRGPKATYKQLRRAFRRSGSRDLEQKVTDLLVAESSSSSDEEAHDVFSSSLHGAPHHSRSTHSSIIGNSSYFSYQPSCDPQTHSNPTIPLHPVHTPVLPYHHQPHLPYPLHYLMPQRPNTVLALQHCYFPPPPTSLYHNQHYNVPSYQTTTANTLTHSSQFSHDPSHDGPPLPQQPRLDNPSYSSSHVTHSLSTPFSPHVGQSSDTIPSSSGTTSSRPPSHPSPYSSSGCASRQHSPSHGLSPPKHPRLDTAPSSPLTTLHPTSTVVLYTAEPHQDPRYESTSTVASPSVAPPPPPATTASPCLQRYVAYLKQLYIARKTPVYDKESSLLYFKAKSFINIALVHKNVKTMTESDKNEMIMDRLHGHVDAIQKKKTNINFSNVCKCEDGSIAHSVLVEGAPGVGKTTFAFELCKQWARGEILQEWGVVVTIKLRDQRTRTAQTIDDLLYHPDPEIRQAVTELVRQDGKGMLLILDGYDELTTKQRESGSVIQWLMSRELLCRATLMVTSRPLATRTLHPNFQQSIDQHIEVLGFTGKNIEEYINSACGDNPKLVEDFKEYLSSHPFSSALMFNPLQCAIVTDLYRSHWQCGDKGFAPKTLTELYTGLVHTLLLRYLTHHPVHKDNDWTIKNLNDLPEDVKQQLKAVTALAAKGIEDQQYVFDSNVPSETLGLMQREEELTAGIGRSSSHNFLHLTLQEYLAAVNYSQQCDSPKQLTQLLTRDDLFPLSSFLQYYGKKRKHTVHWPVALFLAGRTQLSGVPLDLLKAGLHYSSVDVSLLHLLYETQCPQLIQSTLVTRSKYISVYGRSALDWFVIGYCIANSTSSWRVEKKANDVLKYFNQLVMGLKLAPQDGSGEGKIVSLDISGSWSGNFKILSQLQTFTKTVTDIILVGPKQDVQRNPVSSKGKSNVEQMLDCYPLLEELRIENAAINFPYSCFISHQSNLHTVTLKGCKLSSEATSSLIDSLLSPRSIPLSNLSLYVCTISTSDLTCQVSSIKLQLTNAKACLNATGSCCALNHWLSQLSSYSELLTDMILNITEQDSSTDDLLMGIGLYHHEQNSLTLSLTNGKLSSEATSSLVRSLQSPHCKLHKLLLRDCTISTTDNSYQLPSLELQQANAKISLNATGSYCAMNQWLSSYSTLLTDITLYITGKHSSTDDELVEIGCKQNNLHTLSLKRCKLSSEAASSLVHSLQSPHCRLHKLSLRDCTILSTDRTLFATAIASSTTITHLFFIDIDAPSLTALASSLKQNSTMEEIAVDNRSKLVTDNQFQLLIKGVDSSAVKKLWLWYGYKKLLSDHPLSRDDVVIEWYTDSSDVYEKW